MISDYFNLAFKNLKHRGIRSWLTLLGIFIGVTAVVSLISLGNGLQAAISSQFGVSSTQVITIQAGGVSFGPPGSGVVKKLTIQDSDAIEKLSTVEMTIPRNIEIIPVETDKSLRFLTAVSLPDGQKRKKAIEVVDVEAESGRLLQDGDTRKIVIGHSLSEDTADNKGLQIGSKVSIKGDKFEVVGILKKKGSLIFDNAVIMNNDDLEKIVGYGDDVDIIAAIVKDKDLMDEAKTQIEKLMRDRRDVKKGYEDFRVSTPEAELKTVNDVLNAVNIFVLIIALISVFVGAIGIVNTMTTSVLERRKEIGTMKAVGGRNGQIFMQFFFESGMLGLIGGLVGVILGTLIGIGGVGAINAFLGAELKPSINFILILGTLAGSFVIGAIAGIAPAMNAAKQNPVEALRG